MSNIALFSLSQNL